MTIRALNLSRAFRSAFLAGMLLIPFAAVHAQGAAPARGASGATATGARAYWCKSPNGTAALQTESCAPGTEVRSEPLGPHGTVGKQAIPSPVVADPSAPSPAAVAARPVVQAPEITPVIDVTAPGGNLKKIVLVAIFMLLGVGVVLFLLRKHRQRSY